MAETLANTNGALLLKQSTAFVRPFYFGTASTTVTVNISKNGAAFGPAAGAVAEISAGWYKVSLTTADTGILGPLAYNCTGLAGGPVDFLDNVTTQLFSDLSINVSGQPLISSNIKQNAAFNGFLFVMTVNGVPTAGLTVTAKRSLGGAGFTNCANAVTEVGSGVYAINLAAADLNSNSVMLQFTSTGADTRYIWLVTQP